MTIKTSTKLALLGSVALSLSAWSVAAQNDSGSAPSDQPPPRRMGGPPGAPPGPPAIVGALDANGDGVIDAEEIAGAAAALAKLDKNGDGKLTPDEFIGPRAGGRGFGPPLSKEILDKYDLDKDGKLDEQERAALQKDIQAGKIQPPGPPPRGRGKDAAGPPSPPNAKDLLAKFDANGDGKLDATELAAMLDDMKAHRPPPPGGGGRQGPQGPPPPDQP